MKNLIILATLAVSIGLGGCATVFRQAPGPGDPEPLVRQKMGAPTAVHQVGPDRVLEYATGPMGQQTFMARIGPDGRLASWEQVLRNEKFATIEVDAATRDEVLRTFGRPAEISRVALHDYEVWSYRYKESGVWNALMHVHFDRQGVVRLLMSGPDPLFDPKDRAGW